MWSKYTVEVVNSVTEGPDIYPLKLNIPNHLSRHGRCISQPTELISSIYLFLFLFLNLFRAALSPPPRPRRPHSPRPMPGLRAATPPVQHSPDGVKDPGRATETVGGRSAWSAGPDRCPGRRTDPEASGRPRPASARGQHQRSSSGSWADRRREWELIE